MLGGEGLVTVPQDDDLKRGEQKRASKERSQRPGRDFSKAKRPAVAAFALADIYVTRDTAKATLLRPD